MQFRDLNTVLGIELNIINDHEFSCRYCVVEKHKMSLTISNSNIIEGTLPGILETLPKSFPVALTLTGKGLIHKNINVSEQSNPDDLFQKAFPAVDEKDFYVQSFANGQNALISIIRKQLVDDLVNKMERSGLSIFIVSLGAMVSAHVWGQLNNYTTAIAFDGHVFQLSSTHEFLSYQHSAGLKNEFLSKIGQEQIAEENIVAYAAAFQLLLHKQLHLIHANVEQVNLHFLHFTQNAVLKQIAMFFLFALFGTLLINYTLFSYYNNKNAALSQRIGVYSANADQIDVSRKNISENESLLKQLNWNGGFNYGLLVNEIAESMPKQLQLHEIGGNEIKVKLDTATKAPHIKISGVTDNLTAVNNWIFVLKQKSWIKTVRLLKYEEDIETEQYKFNLMLTY